MFQGCRALADRFVILRSSPAFWAASDALIDAYAQWAPLEAGLFDYNRLENRCVRLRTICSHRNASRMANL